MLGMALAGMILSPGLGMSCPRAALAREAAAAPYQVYLPLVLRGFPPSVVQTLTVSQSGTGSGTVTSDPAGIDCGPTCSYDFNSGTIVTLTAVQSTGSIFIGWSGGGCDGVGASTCTVRMDVARSVSASFTLIFFALEVYKDGTGSGTVTSSPVGINCGPPETCSSAFAYNSNVTLTATPTSPSAFRGWSGGGCSGTENPCTVTMSEFHSVTATFSICNEIVNCDFEAGANGWIEHSALGYKIIYSSTDPVDPLPDIFPPHSGTHAAWLGGVDGEIAYLQQQVNIPSSAPTLVYWHWIVSYDNCGYYDYAEVVINGIQEDKYDLCTGTSTMDWVPHSVNLNAYIGRSVTLRIGVNTNSSNISSLFVDDVTLQAGAPATAPLQVAILNMEASTP